LPDDRIVGVEDKVYRFNANGSWDTGFVHPTLTNTTGGGVFVTTVDAQTDGKLVVGGSFDFVGTARRSGVARLNSDGSLDSLDVGKIQLEVQASKFRLQSDDKIVAFGSFG